MGLEVSPNIPLGIQSDVRQIIHLLRVSIFHQGPGGRLSTVL